MGLAVSGLQYKRQCHSWTIKESPALNPAFEHFVAQFSIDHDFRIEFSITNSMMNSDPRIHQ